MLKPSELSELMVPEVNRFHFVCPIFNSEVAAADCFTLEYEWMRGQKHPERAGCIACMASSKCPVRYMMKELHQGKSAYFSPVRQLGSVSGDVREEIAPIRVLDSILNDYGVSGEERDAIVGSVIAGKSKPMSRRPTSVAPLVKRTVTAEKPVEEDFAAKLTATNDMAGAITIAVQDAAGAPVAAKVDWVATSDTPIEPPRLALKSPLEIAREMAARKKELQQ